MSTRRLVLVAAVVLVLVDVAVLGGGLAHRLHRTRDLFPAFESVIWRPNRDRGVVESVGYVQMALAAAGLIWLWATTRRAGCLLALAVVLLVMIGDDALEWHERLGAWLVRNTAVEGLAAVRGQDVGEVLVWAAMGLPLLILVVVGFARSDPWPRRVALQLAAAFVALALFAVALDLLNPVLDGYDLSRRASYLLGFTEAAGELLAMSAVLVIVVAHVGLRRRQRREAKEPVGRSDATGSIRT